MRRLLVGLALSGALFGATAPAVLGHECVIENRSTQGDDAAAAHSQVWVRLTLSDLFGFIHEFVGGPALAPGQVDWAVAAAIDAGLPADGWVTRSDKTIGEGSQNPNLADGRGLDHLADTVGEQVVSIYFQALGH